MEGCRMNFTKVTFNLPEAEVAQLTKLANEQNKTITEILRQAILNYAFFIEEKNNGGAVYIEYSNGTICNVAYK